MAGMFDTLVTIETKMDNNFPVPQLHMGGFSIPYRINNIRNGDRVIAYVREDATSKLLSRRSFKDGRH